MCIELAELPDVLVPGFIPNIALTYRETWFTETGWYLADEVDQVLDKAEGRSARWDVRTPGWRSRSVV